MGTKVEKNTIKKQINDVQVSLKNTLTNIGWSLRKAGRWIYYEQNDTDLPEEIERFIEKFKKDMSRESSTLTKLNQLKEYQKILFQLDEVKRAGYVLPENHMKFKFDESFNNKMRQLSKNIDKILISNAPPDDIEEK